MRNRYRRASALILCAQCATSGAAAGELKVTVSNIKMSGARAEGTVYVCLYPSSAKDKPKFPSCEQQDVPGVKKQPIAAADISNGKGQLSFQDLGDGDYALSAFQDSNPTDGFLSMGATFPKERVGTYRKSCTKPAFDDIKFAFPAVSQASIKVADISLLWVARCLSGLD